MRVISLIVLSSLNVAPGDSPVAASQSNGALYAFLTALAVAALALIGQVIQSKTKASPTSRTAKRTAAHYEACKLFITLNTEADVRKIKDGYESMNEVRRA